MSSHNENKDIQYIFRRNCGVPVGDYYKFLDKQTKRKTNLDNKNHAASMIEAYKKCKHIKNCSKFSLERKANTFGPACSDDSLEWEVSERDHREWPTEYRLKGCASKCMYYEPIFIRKIKNFIKNGLNGLNGLVGKIFKAIFKAFSNLLTALKNLHWTIQVIPMLCLLFYLAPTSLKMVISYLEIIGH